MFLKLIFISLQLILYVHCDVRGPPQFETNPQYSGSYLPATMQIISYLTEMMKLDLTPGAQRPTSTTTTTPRPTPSHLPGLFAPPYPPPRPYSSINEDTDEGRNLRRSVMNNIKQFERRISPEEERNILQYLGPEIINLYGVIGDLHPNQDDIDEDARLKLFSVQYDDHQFYIKQKKIPPTRAYVTLLNLYDLLNKEAKKLGLNKFNGFTEGVIKELVASSTGTSAQQLRFVLNRMIQNKDTSDAKIISKMESLIADLNKDDSYLNLALSDIPPLSFDY